MDTDKTHPCPGCSAPAPARKLACTACLAKVPPPLMRAMYASWAGGKGQGSKGYARAREAVIAAMR